MCSKDNIEIENFKFASIKLETPHQILSSLGLAFQCYKSVDFAIIIYQNLQSYKVEAGIFLFVAKQKWPTAKFFYN